MKVIGNCLIAAGICLLIFFGYQYYHNEHAQNIAFVEAKELIENNKNIKIDRSDKKKDPFSQVTFDYGQSIGILKIPKLERSLAIVEGTDPDSLSKGVGHLSESVLPGQGEQIILSGHRDTVFRDFGDLTIGDQFIVEMPYGKYHYEIKETEIVPEDDTSVIRKMGKEVLVVTTCYPFYFIGNAPERFIIYAYPVEKKGL
ncbi:class D sortase [Niallia circulans]|uniref:class D sortase n=1 Tax=Niallia circulans TaxID=1397 RepID=UPI000F459315|nr:class D sortase [Niallia circulans]AYV68210.1 class D sortase [Niallia circulans]AYV73394.1 class D sortase [Niallia circulans]